VCDLPLFEEYRIERGRWWQRDTIKVAGSCAPLRDEIARPERIDSGTYKVRGDTLHFYSYDTRQGITKFGRAGWVMFGVVRGDTLLFPGGVFTPFDPGDMVYVRVP